jgi:membrane protein
MPAKNIWAIIKQSFKDFNNDNVLKLSASLAFSTIFAIPGLLIIILWITTFFYGREAIEGTIYNQISSFVGHDAAVYIQQLLKNAVVSKGRFATIIGIISLGIGATGVFSEIQDSINTIWRLKAKPKKGRGLITMVINRLVSFSMVISLGFILLVSLVINGAMDLLMVHLLHKFPQLTVIVAYIINLGMTFFITAFVFALIFKVLPDAKVEWKHVRIGAMATAFLFMVGKFLISYYLANSFMSTVYGAAGSVIVILLWVYYSSMILYFGAVFTRAYAVCTGGQIFPNKYAVWIQNVEVESKKPITAETDVKHNPQ